MNASAAGSILFEGAVVSVKLAASSLWKQNIIYSVDDQNVSIALQDVYLYNVIMKGSAIVIKYTNEYFEYLFEGTVAKINPQYPASVLVHIDKCEELINTRAFQRFDTHLAAYVIPIWDDVNYFSVVTNISLGGMAFICKENFGYGDELNVCMYTPGSKTICVTGKVIRRSVKNSYIDYSMQFIQMLEEDSIVLSEYLDDLDSKIREMQEEYMNKIRPLIT